jgi:hypothetical protein
MPGGYRLRRKRRKYSYEFEAQLEASREFINADPTKLRVRSVFDWPQPFPYEDYYAAGADDPVELFARAVVISVLFPRVACDAIPALHASIVRILRNEFLERLPQATVNRFCRRLECRA